MEKWCPSCEFINEVYFEITWYFEDGTIEVKYHCRRCRKIVHTERGLYEKTVEYL